MRFVGINLKANFDRHAQITAENNHSLKSLPLSFKTTISLDSQDRERRNTLGNTDDLKSVLHDSHNFSQTELFGSFLANYVFLDKYEAALGMQYARDHWGPGWGDSRQELRMGETDTFTGSSIWIINGLDSTTVKSGANGVAFGNNTYFTGGWGTNTYSPIWEINLPFHKLLTLIYSGRVDKNSYAELPLFSQRFAAVSDLEKWGVVKFIMQESVRLTTATQLFLAHENGQKRPDPERLRSFEFIYEKSPFENFTVTSSSFLNRLQALGWGSSTTTLLGLHKIIGTEIEGKYQTKHFTFGINHSYVKQLLFKRDGRVRNTPISYSDYTRIVNGIQLQGAGNDINNWSNNGTKLFTNLTYRKLTTHMDMRIFWGFQGSKDGLEMLENAVQGTAREIPVENAIAALRGRDVYEMDMRLNMALSYPLTKYLKLTVFCMNLLSVNDAKRYNYDAGISSAAPHRSAWVAEPRVFGFRVDTHFD